MRIDEVGRRLDYIKELVEDIKSVPIYTSVASKQEQKEMFERIERIFDLYDLAIENDEKYISNIRKELNSVINTLKKWLEYDEKKFLKRLEKYMRFL